MVFALYPVRKGEGNILFSTERMFIGDEEVTQGTQECKLLLYMDMVFIRFS